MNYLLMSVTDHNWWPEGHPIWGISSLGVTFHDFSSLQYEKEKCGDFPMRKWVCQYMLADKSFVHPETQEIYFLWRFVHCRMTNVVYGIICPCKKIYVGQTSQELRKQIQRHFSSISLAKRDIQQGKTLTTVAAHYLQYHTGKCAGTSIVGLDWVQPNIRGGDNTSAIHKRNTVAPKGFKWRPPVYQFI